jgi:ribosomal protein S18 acetylase RimI-like enzyme
VIARVLERSEYGRLAGTELEAVAAHLPEAARVLVVEDDGAIVGCWSALPLWHLEGLWIAPEHRGRSSVARRLLAGMRGILRGLGARTALTAAVSDDVADMALRLGGFQLPGRHFVLTIDQEQTSCRQR